MSKPSILGMIGVILTRVEYLPPSMNPKSERARLPFPFDREAHTYVEGTLVASKGHARGTVEFRIPGNHMERIMNEANAGQLIWMEPARPREPAPAE